MNKRKSIDYSEMYAALDRIIEGGNGIVSGIKQLPSL